MEVGDTVFLNKRGLFRGSAYDTTLLPHSRLEKNTKYKINHVAEGMGPDGETTYIRINSYYYNIEHFVKYDTLEL